MLTKKRNTEQRRGDQFVHKMLAGMTIFKGALTVLDGAFACAGKTATGLIAIGVAENSVRNDGGDGAESIKTRTDGIWGFDNSPTDPITLADINYPCFIVDDHTVARTDGGTTRSEAGIIRAIEGDQIFIQFK